MEIMLSTIVAWLSFGLLLPEHYAHPRIEFVSQETMRLVRVDGTGSRPLSTGVAHSEFADNIQALYNDRNRTIYLAAGWTGDTPAELSILVHEMVHHLQNVAGLKYACAEEREKLAYTAQEQWLALFGRSLWEDFRIDPLTLLVRTRCMY